MKSTAIVCVIAAAGLSFSALSFADDNDRRGPRGEPQRVQQHGPRYMDQHEQRRFDHRDARRNDRNYYYNARSPEFRRGGYIPREYRTRNYYVTDYRAHRLIAHMVLSQ